MLTVLVAALGGAGWALWLVARRDLAEARTEAQEAHERARLSEGAASAVRASEASARDSVHAAETQVRIAQIELAAMRRALALADADRAALAAQVEALGSDPGSKRYDSDAGKLRLYRKPGT